jgi:hypothetical protein
MVAAEGPSIAKGAASRFGRLRAALFLAGLGLAGWHAHAATECLPTADPRIERCSAGLDSALASRLRQSQDASQWCWAASVSMILGRYGIPVSQREVVREALGRPDNRALDIGSVAELLNRPWRDGAGQLRASSATPLPPWRKSWGLAAPEVIEDLEQGRPLLLAAQHHAMVLVELVYERPVAGKAQGPVKILRATVLDPQAASGLRSLTAAESRPDFLARVSIEGGEPTTTAEAGQLAPLRR